jgi:hypothetical protein
MSDTAVATARFFTKLFIVAFLVVTAEQQNSYRSQDFPLNFGRLDEFQMNGLVAIRSA